MKICLTVNSSPWSRFKGGGQIAVHHLASALCGKGHDVVVLYSKAPGELVDPPNVPYRICWVRHFNAATFKLNVFSFAWALFCLDESFDVVHGNAEESCFTAWVCGKGKYFFTSHAPWIPPTGFLGGMLNPIFFLKRLNFYLLRSAAARARRVITFSRFSHNLVLEGLGRDWEDKIIVVPPGIDRSWLVVQRDPAPSHDVLFWGRVEDEKGIPELLRAFKYVAAQVPTARLTIAGEGNRLSAYKVMCRELEIEDNVKFAGWLGVADIQALASKSAVGVFPSHVESFGLAVAEAMAGGLPVVATRVGALPEIVEDGVTGTLVPLGDVTALTRAIVNVLDDGRKYRQMADRAREFVRQHYSWDNTADRVLEIYKDA
jgi:glycosyltransferase involved in cell wall biosynthesis